MAPYFTIALEGLVFHAPHGLYEGEASAGNAFEVGLRLQADAAAAVTEIGETIDYVRAYAIIQEIMNEREALLETICQRIAARLEADFPALRAIEITIRKLTPAIPKFRGAVSVSFTKQMHPNL